MGKKHDDSDRDNGADGGRILGIRFIDNFSFSGLNQTRSLKTKQNIAVSTDSSADKISSSLIRINIVEHLGWVCNTVSKHLEKKHLQNIPRLSGSFDRQGWH